MYVLSISILCVHVFLTTSRVEAYLEAPNLLSVTAVEPEGLFVEWTVVREMGSDPLLGFKIHIYEIPEYSEFAGNEKKDKSLEKFNANNTGPAPREEIIKGKVTKTTVYNIKNNVLYEVRVLAYKKDGNGPPSLPIRIKIMKDKDYSASVSRTSEGCQVAVPLGNIELADTFPYIYNSYF